MPETRIGLKPNDQRGIPFRVGILLLLFFFCGLHAHGYYGHASRATGRHQDEEGVKDAQAIQPGRSISRSMTAKTAQHFYSIRLAKNQLVYVSIRQKELSLKAEVFRPGGPYLALHTGGAVGSELTFPISAASGGTYLIKLSRADGEASARESPAGYTILVTAMPLLKINGGGISGVTSTDTLYYGLYLKAGESVYIETNAREELNIMVFDPQGNALQGSKLGTDVRSMEQVVSSLVLHAQAAGLYRAEVRPGYNPAHRPLAYKIRAGVVPLLRKGKPYALARGNNVYDLQFAAGQLLRAEFLSSWGGVPNIYIQEPNGGQRRPIVKTSPGGSTLTFIAAAAGRHALIIDTSKIRYSATQRLQVTALRASSPRDRDDFAAQSCKGSADPRKHGTFRDELRYFDRCFYGLSYLVADAHPDVLQLSGNVSEDIKLLIGRWDNKPLMPLYRNSLDTLYGGFEAAQHTDHESAYSILRDVASDIRIKAEHCRKSKNGRGLGDPVKFTVTTVQGGKSVKGYIVFCAPTLKEYDRSFEPIAFDRPSDPRAETYLAPGEYKVWGERSEEDRKKIKNTAKIGFGNATQEMAIYVP